MTDEAETAGDSTIQNKTAPDGKLPLPPMIPKPVFNAAAKRQTAVGHPSDSNAGGMLPLILCGLALLILAAGAWLAEWDALRLGGMAAYLIFFWPIGGFVLYLIFRLARLEPPRRRRVLAATLAFLLAAGLATARELQRMRLYRTFRGLTAAMPLGQPLSVPWGFWGAKRKVFEIFVGGHNRRLALMGKFNTQFNQLDEMETKEGMTLLELKNLPRHEETLKKKRLAVSEVRQEFYGTLTELDNAFQDVQREISGTGDEEDLNLILQGILDRFKNFDSSESDMFDMIDDIIEQDSELTEFLKNTGDRYRLEGDRLVFEFPEEERAFLRHAAAQQEAIQQLQKAIKDHGESVKKEMAQ